MATVVEVIDNGVAIQSVITDTDNTVIAIVRPLATTLEVVSPGPQGPPGPPGAGASGSFVHNQVAPAATWTITHNLGTKPAVVLELASDPSGHVYTDITYPDLNTVVVEWPSAESGKAYL